MNPTIDSQFHQMWDTRPVRLPRNQSPRTWFFGVCEGIAVRYQISPVFVRLVIGLSVALGGLGLWFYLVALLVLPRYGVPLSPAQVLLRNQRDPRYAHDRSVGVRTIIIGAVLLLISGVGSGGVTLSGVLGGVVVTGIAWWLLHQRLETPPAGLLTPADDAAPTSTATYAGADLGSLTPAGGFAPPRTTPPSWDPLGAAPFAWDLPDPPEPAAADEVHGPKTSGRSPWRKLAKILLGLLLAFILMISAAIALAVGGVLPGQSEDTETTSSRRFTEQSVAVNSFDRDRRIEAVFSDIDVNLSDAAFPDSTASETSSTGTRVTLSVTGRFSNIRVNIPESTQGAAYRVRIDCAQVAASDVDCSSADGIVVPADAQGNITHTLVLRLDSTVSQISVGRAGQS